MASNTQSTPSVPPLAQKLGLDTDTYFKRASGKLFGKVKRLFDEGVRGIVENGRIKRIEAYVPGVGFRMVKPIVIGDTMYLVLQQRSKKRDDVKILASESFPSLIVSEEDFDCYVK